jgi:hypothetical protein
MFLFWAWFLSFSYWYTLIRGTYEEPGVWLVEDDAASDGTVETLAYNGDGADDAWSACDTEAGQEE